MYLIKIKKSFNSVKNLKDILQPHRTFVRVLPSALQHTKNQKLLVAKYALSQEIDRIKNTVLWIRSRTMKQWLIAGGISSSILVVSAIGLTVLFLTPRNHTYTYSGSNCFMNPVVLPNTIDSRGDETYKTTLQPKISVGNTPLLSTTTCIEIAKIPEETKNLVSLQSPLPLSKDILLTSNSLPTLTPYESIKNPVSPDAVLLFGLDQLDETFSYSLTIGDKTIDCVLHTTLLGCPLINFGLGQGQTYDYNLVRVLGADSSQHITSTITTLDPVIIKSSSIQPNELIFDNPKSFHFTTNKVLKNIGKVTLSTSDTQSNIPVESSFKENILTIDLLADLPRNTNFSLTIDGLTSDDGSFLASPYILNFKTSSGPQVQAINIGDYKVSANASITLTFDTELDPNQPASDYLSITNEAGLVPSTTNIRNNTITINPSGQLGACSTFLITLKDGIKNKYGVSGNSAWNKKSRTICQKTFSIGNSVQGRSITGYRFGSGATTILVVGGMHGDEKSSVKTLNSFIDDLEQNYSSIPSDKTVIVIPNTNPDGFNASTRTNANVVDLNRNFPTFNWASGVYMPRNIYLENGGGTTPLSEPESSLLANYTSSLSPRVVLTFHATGRAVFANDAGDSKSLADIYAQKSGFTSYSDADSNTFFSYPTTGEYEDWIRDILGLPALLVELASVGNNEFSRQKPALWAMLSL